MGKKKVVVIGIDGGEFDVLTEFASTGIMPFTDTMLKRGFAADIDTYVNGHGQGWASFITGKSPEKHKVFYWNLYTRLVTSKTFRDKMIWDVLGENGIKSCVINMSYTYPPKPFNGFMISGLGSGLSVSDNLKITYPEDLMDEIRKSTGDYIVACDFREGDIDTHEKLLNNLIEMTRYRTDACLYIMEKYSPEVVLVVYRGADLIQHCYWNLLDNDREIPEKYKQLQSLIEKYYNELDKSIEKIFRKYDDPYKIIVSDHGFGQVNAIVYLNNYLAECGMLTKKVEMQDQKGVQISGQIRKVMKTIYIKHLKRYKLFKKLNRLRTEMHGIDLPIDMNRTVAYSGTLYGVNINKQTVTPDNMQEAKNKVIKLLENLRDPRTKEKVIERIYPKEHSYAKDMKDVPDVLFENNEKYLVTYEMKPNDDTVFRYMDKEMTAFFTGSHRREGIFILDNIDKAQIEARKGLKITDVFTTILDLFGVEVHEDIDGKSILAKR